MRKHLGHSQTPRCRSTPCRIRVSAPQMSQNITSPMEALLNPQCLYLYPHTPLSRSLHRARSLFHHYTSRGFFRIIKNVELNLLGSRARIEPEPKQDTPSGIPGFSIESIITGILSSAIILMLFRRARARPQPSQDPLSFQAAFPA